MPERRPPGPRRARPGRSNAKRPSSGGGRARGVAIGRHAWQCNRQSRHARSAAHAAARSAAHAATSDAAMADAAMADVATSDARPRRGARRRLPGSRRTPRLESHGSVARVEDRRADRARTAWRDLLSEPPPHPPRSVRSRQPWSPTSGCAGSRAAVRVRAFVGVLDTRPGREPRVADGRPSAPSRRCSPPPRDRRGESARLRGQRQSAPPRRAPAGRKAPPSRADTLVAHCPARRSRPSWPGQAGRGE